MKFREFGIYLLCLLPWFLAGLFFTSDASYYVSLILPIFAPSSIVFPIVWSILYLLIAYSIYQVRNRFTTNYKIYLVINYLSNQFFTFCFFTLKNNFLALADTIIVLISSMYLYVETKGINREKSWYLIPYILWNVFAFILIFSIFLMN